MRRLRLWLSHRLAEWSRALAAKYDETPEPTLDDIKAEIAAEIEEGLIE